MARGTLQMAWINKGDSSEEHYHVMYGVEGENKTMKARNVKGREALSTMLANDLCLLPERVSRVLEELQSSGTSNVAGLNVADADLKRLDLA